MVQSSSKTLLQFVVNAVSYFHQIILGNFCKLIKKEESAKLTDCFEL